MSRILKYKISHLFQENLVMPENSVILKVGVQDDSVFIWVKAGDNVSTCRRCFETYGTSGWLIAQDNLYFLDTVFLSGGLLAYHIFERIERKDQVESVPEFLL